MSYLKRYNSCRSLGKVNVVLVHIQLWHVLLLQTLGHGMIFEKLLHENLAFRGIGYVEADPCHSFGKRTHTEDDLYGSGWLVLLVNHQKAIFADFSL